MTNGGRDAERNRRIFSDWMGGKTFASIAREMCLSRTRVSSIVESIYNREHMLFSRHLFSGDDDSRVALAASVADKRYWKTHQATIEAIHEAEMDDYELRLARRKLARQLACGLMLEQMLP